MKKSMLALAALTAFAGAASAQSSVTLFGGIDLNLRNVSSGANKFVGIGQDGIYSSRLGFRGVEDLGGGLKGSFHLEGGTNPDTGTPGGFNFLRRSVLGVSGGGGEVLFGRDYTPLFTVHGVFDPFGTNGVGSAGNLMFSTVNNASTGATAGTTFRTRQAATVSGTGAASTVAAGTVWADPNAVRANNSITYVSPNFSGFSAALMLGYGNENTSSAKSQGKVTSLKLAYDAGPLSVAFASQSTKGGLNGAAASQAAVAYSNAATGCLATQTDVTADMPAVAGSKACLTPAAAAVMPTDDQKWSTTLLGAGYNFGVARVSIGSKSDKIPTVGTAKTILYGISAPMGALTLKGTYMAKKVAGADAGTQLAIGGVYDLSKRTALYSTYSRLNNDAGFGNVVGSAAASDFSGLTSRGFEVGLKHTF